MWLKESKGTDEKFFVQRSHAVLEQSASDFPSEWAAGPNYILALTVTWSLWP
jgi:hypothetical protein